MEITSPDNADYDRYATLTAYAHGKVPCYLLVDGWTREGSRRTVYSDPAEGEYRRTTITPFGEAVDLPEPIGPTLDTGRFG